MKLRIDSLSLWKLIAACNRTKSLGKACVQVGMSLSQASKLISSFEESSGINLLDRSTRPAQLTKNFELLVPTALRMLSVYEETSRAIQKIQTEASSGHVGGRVIRICLPMNVRNDSVLSNLMDYAERGPGLRLEFFCDDGLRRLMDGSVDIAQMGYNPRKQEIRADYIRTNGFLILASKSFVRKYQLPNQIEDLPNYPIVIRNPSNQSFSRRLQKGEQVFFLPDYTKVIYADAMTCRSLLLMGHAIALDVSIGSVLDELKRGEVFPILSGWHRKPNDTYVCTHMKNSGDSVINDLMNIISSTLRAEKADDWKLWASRFGFDLDDLEQAL